MTASLHALGAGRDAGNYYVIDANRQARPRDRDEYYTRDTASGIWWSTGDTLVEHGATIDPDTFRDLCAGLHPVSHASLVRAAGPAHRAGWDITFSAPKSVSILWAAGDATQRAAIVEAHRTAVARALAFIVDEGLISVRIGAGGYEKQQPTDLIVGRFEHYSSREGDPNLHAHCVLLNVAGSRDGRYRTLEPRGLYDWQLVVGAAYRATLAENLAAMGFRFRDAGTNQIEIAGIPVPLIEAFSRRSEQIKSHARDGATAIEKEIAALATRSAKDEIPYGPALEKRWRDDLARLEAAPWQAARGGPHPEQDMDPPTHREFDPPEITGEGPVVTAAAALLRHTSVLFRKELIRQALVCGSREGAGVDAVLFDLERLEADGLLKRLDGTDRTTAWTTPAIAAVEAGLIRAAARPDEATWIRPGDLATALMAAPHLSVEQQEAVRHAAGRDGVSLIEAGAGTGKTTLAQVIVAAARRSGLQVIGLAPSWVAADELGKSLGIETMALAKYRHDESQGRGRAVDDRTLILLDEAGMTGLRDFAAVLAQAQANGAKVVCLGDRRQLEAVAAGGALRAVAETLARSATLNAVRRQEVGWQRAASVAMAKGDAQAGLRAYAQQGRVRLVDGVDAARDTTIETWRAFRQEHGEDVLIVTRRNRDASALNLLARDVRRAEGNLTGDDMVVRATGRDGKAGDLALAIGERIRFGETLTRHRIRNGTLGHVEALVENENGIAVAVRLDDGRLISERWAALVPDHRLEPSKTEPPRIAHAYAGTAYAAQGRTVPAAVLHVASATDAREIYVGLTRHRLDARVVVERDRLDAAVRARQEDPREAPGPTAVMERLFREAGRYTHKANVADFVEDRTTFVRTGMLPEREARVGSNIRLAAHAAERMALEKSGPDPRMPFLFAFLARINIRARSLAIVDRLRAILDRRPEPLLERHRGRSLEPDR